MDAAWPEFKTPLRTWSIENRGFEYFQIIADDMDIVKSAAAHAVADKLMCDVTGVDGLWQRLDLASASPYVQ